MIKYTTADIIKRAEQIADLQNSDFVSADEKQYLLNEAFTQVYQKIIEANDKTWVKIISFTGSIRLPKDFYELSALYSKKSKQQITKINAAQNYGYEIKNNYLTVPSSFSEVVMEYYPVPETLFYKDPIKEPVEFEHEPSIIINEDAYFSTDYKVYVNEEETITVDSTKVIYRFKNGYLEKNDDKWQFKNYNNEIVEERESGNPFAVIGNEISYDLIEGEIPQVDDNKAIIIFFDKNMNLKNYFMYGNDELKIYNKDLQIVNVKNMEASLVSASFYCREDGLYFCNSSGLFRISNDVIETFSNNLMKPISIIDEATAIYSYVGEYYKAGYGFNTVLNYPNNLYYTALAYSLAISFKLKQNGDITNLSSKYSEAIDQLLATISRDSNDVYQIKNVYSGGGFGIWS